jgi:hypothetical protein
MEKGVPDGSDWVGRMIGVGDEAVTGAGEVVAAVVDWDAAAAVADEVVVLGAGGSGAISRPPYNLA